MPPMHSTPRPPRAAPSTSAFLAADQTLQLSFPPKTPGGTHHGGMDDWLGGIDLPLELELEEDVLTGFGERTGNLFGVAEGAALAWSARTERLSSEDGRVGQQEEAEHRPTQQLPTPSPEPGSLPLPPATSAAAVASSSSANKTTERAALPASSGPTAKATTAASDGPRPRPAPSALADPQPVASGSSSRSSTASLRPPGPAPARETRKRTRSPAADEPPAPRRTKRAERPVDAQPVASSSRVPSRSSRSRSPQPSAPAPPPPAVRAPPSQPPPAASTRVPRRSSVAPVASAAHTLAARPPPPRNPPTAAPSHRPAANDSFHAASTSFSFTYQRDQPPKDDFFARRLRDSYIGPVGITGLAASSSPPLDGAEDEETLEQGISRLREEVAARPRQLLDAPLAAAPVANRPAPVEALVPTARSPSPEPEPSPSEPARHRRQSTSESVVAFFSKYLAPRPELQVSVAADPPPAPAPAPAAAAVTAAAPRPSSKRPRPRSPSPPPAKRSREPTGSSTASSSSRAPFGDKARGDGNGRVAPSATTSSARTVDLKGKGRAARPDPGKRPLPPPARPAAAEPFEKRITKPRPFVFQPLASSSRSHAPATSTAAPAGKPAGFVPSFKASHSALALHAEARATALAAQRAKLAAERDASSRALFSGLEARMAQRGRWEDEVRRKDAEKEAKRRADEEKRREKEASDIREERRRTVVRARPVPDMYRRPAPASAPADRV